MATRWVRTVAFGLVLALSGACGSSGTLGDGCEDFEVSVRPVHVAITREQAIDPDVAVGDASLEAYVTLDGDPADGIPVGFYFNDDLGKTLVSITGADGIARTPLDRDDISFRYTLEGARTYYGRVDIKDIICANPTSDPAPITFESG